MSNVVTLFQFVVDGVLHDWGISRLANVQLSNGNTGNIGKGHQMNKSLLVAALHDCDQFWCSYSHLQHCSHSCSERCQAVSQMQLFTQSQSSHLPSNECVLWLCSSNLDHQQTLYIPIGCPWCPSNQCTSLSINSDGGTS